MKSNKKVAILFFGLTRSLNKTSHSLHENLFNHLTNNSIDYDIFIHTYKIYGPYINRWSKEKTKKYNNEDVEKLLNPKYFIHDDQNEIIKTIDFNEYYKKLGNWTGDFTSDATKYLIRNMVLALYSKKKITLLFDQHINEYDYAIIIRPDMEIKTKIDISYFDLLNDNNIIIPEDDWWAGCNDRMCIAKPSIISYCGKLYDELKSYSERKNIISERYFQDKLKEKNITIIAKKIIYNTLRI